jgi:hypothetical protein
MENLPKKKNSVSELQNKYIYRRIYEVTIEKIKNLTK